MRSSQTLNSIPQHQSFLEVATDAMDGTDQVLQSGGIEGLQISCDIHMHQQLIKNYY